jgi:DNA (cytosine-5)-methyltransferase 1
MRPVLLDLYCGAGGASAGYYRAGWRVVGVDIAAQPRYPFAFHRGDALELLPQLLAREPVAAIHASPPCQAYTALSALQRAQYPQLIEPTREALRATGLPFVIENVERAPLVAPVVLCGSMFDLGVWRHRAFEMTGRRIRIPKCQHAAYPRPVDVTGTGGAQLAPRAASRVRGGRSRKPASIAEARQVMGIDWMTRPELAEAIPPAYTEFLGGHLLRQLAGA